MPRRIEVDVSRLERTHLTHAQARERYGETEPPRRRKHYRDLVGTRCVFQLAAGSLRVDDIQENSVSHPEHFNLIFRASVVVMDFTGKNPNVTYETGIAHPLGKHVVPITQSLDNVPFDMQHHRTLR